MTQTDTTTTLQPTQMATDKARISKLPWAVTSTATNAVFAIMTVFGSTFVLFLNQMGISKTQIGFLLSLMPFFGVVAPLFAPIAARFGYKRTFTLFWAIRKVAVGFLLLIPWVYARYGFQAMLVFIAAIIAVFAFCRAMAETAWYPWEQEMVPNSIRGKFNAVRSMISNLCSLAAVLAAGLIIGKTPAMQQFMLVFSIGLVFGWASVWSTTHIFGGKPNKEIRFSRDHFRQMGKTFRDRSFIRYLLGEGVFTLTNVQIGVFLPLFWREQVGLSSGNVIILSTATMTGGILASYLWGWLSDRYGSKPVLLTVVSFSALLPFLWLFMPRHSSISFVGALAASVIQGAISMGVQITFLRILFISVIPPQKKASYTAVYYACIGILSGTSQLVGGRLLDLTSNISGRFLFFTLDPFTFLFLASILFPLISLVLFSGVRADSPVTTRQFAGLFLHGNPLRAIVSLLRYRFAITEPAAVSVADGMGRTHSPLIEDELLESLNDPRFNVRFETVLALARSHQDRRTVEALGKVLQDNDPALAVLAAWALGRGGIPDGIPFLRQGLNAPYRSVQAYSARSLGMLKDTASTALLLQRLEAESDTGLQTAYASALGYMGERQAVPRLLSLLEENQDENQRSEIALSLARIAGDEGGYIRLLRSIQTEPAGSISAALDRLRKKHGRAGQEHPFNRLCRTTSDHFSNDRLAEGIAGITALLMLLKDQIPAEEMRLVYATCSRLIQAHSMTQPDYLALSLHVLSCLSPDIVNRL